MVARESDNVAIFKITALFSTCRHSPPDTTITPPPSGPLSALAIF